MNHIPGTIIFNLKGHLLYFNREALIYLPLLKNRFENTKMPPQLPEEILFAFEKTRANLVNEKSEGLGEVGQSIMNNKEGQLNLRSFAIGDPSQGKTGKFIIVLIEPATAKNLVDIPNATIIFNFSNREIEVIQLICKGLSNKEIGEVLFISDQTVKDHIKHVMRKMKVNSRTQIIATLFNLPQESPAEYSALPMDLKN